VSGQPKPQFTSDGYQIPFGFADEVNYLNFVKVLRQGLPESVEPVFQGSSASGVKGVTSKGIPASTPFDDQRQSDFDIGLIDENLYELAKGAPGARAKTNPDRIGPIGVDMDLAVALGLNDLLKTLSKQAGRAIKFVIYPTSQDAYDRWPVVPVPEIKKDEQLV
jgi:hypothetical protein